MEVSTPLWELRELVLTCWDGNTGGWHACDKATWDACADRTLIGSGPAWSVTLGRLFIDDHESRDLLFGIVVGENKLTYKLLMTVDDIREVYSDACHYADSMGEWLEDDDTGYARSVIQAAARVVEALRKQVPDILV